LVQRILFYNTRDNRQVQQIDAATSQLETDLWAAEVTRAVAQSTAVLNLIVSGMNVVLNSRGYTQAAWTYRMPREAWILMAVIAVFCNSMIGCG
jgi:hypothetical protein